MNRIIAAGTALIVGVLIGRNWPTNFMPTPAPREHLLSARIAEISPQVSRPAPAIPLPHSSSASMPTTASEPVTAKVIDVDELWRQTRRATACTFWNHASRATKERLVLQEEDIDEEGLADISALLRMDATTPWRDNSQPERRAELLKNWSSQIHDACVAAEGDEDELYRGARTAALLGQPEARLRFIKSPPLEPTSTARRIDLWNDWAETAPQLLDAAVAQGDAEALLLRGIALGFDGLATANAEEDWSSLASALPDDPARAYLDLRAYLARSDRDTQKCELVQSLLPQLQQRLDPAQRAAVDAEFHVH